MAYTNIFDILKQFELQVVQSKHYTKDELKNRIIIPLEENGSTTAGTWLAKTSLISALEDGDIFIYKVAKAGASTTTLKINSLAAKTVYRSGTTKLTTQYGVGQYLLLTYNSTNDCFRVINDADANSYAYLRQYQHGSNAAGATNKYPLLSRYNLTNKNGTYDTAYSRYHTDAYLDISDGSINASSLKENGTALSTKYVLASNVGTGSGNIPSLDSNGKLPTSVLPSLAITDTFVVNSQSAMLALSAQVGDVCVRTDLNKNYILKTDGASTLANWQELLTPATGVTSVRVQTGEGLSSSVSTAQTSSLDTTISIASGYTLPTTTEWNNKANSSALGTQVTYSYSNGVLTITTK